MTELEEKLAGKLTKDDLEERKANNGTKVVYIEGWKVWNLANEVFTFSGWSSEILNITVDFVDVFDGRISIGISCTVRVTIKDGTFHDDIGYGHTENQRNKGVAYEQARKIAVTDAVKRALRYFGDRLGNCLYNKKYLDCISREAISKRKIYVKNQKVEEKIYASSQTDIPANHTPWYSIPEDYDNREDIYIEAIREESAKL